VHPLLSVIDKVYVSALKLPTSISWGFPGTLVDQLKVKGGVPLEINAVKVPSVPLPQDVLYNVKFKGSLVPTYT
jgi:hypothetical protein